MRRPGDDLPTSGRLVALDLGRVRVGVAVSDPLQVIASPADTVEVSDLDTGDVMDVDALAARLSGIVTAHDAVGVVVGAPLALDGQEGEAVREARAVADRLRERTGLPVRLVDERFTSTTAERSLIEADVSRADRRRVVDQVAASVLLQGVLAAHGTQGREHDAPRRQGD
jgi:putative holliday junction resolvase